METDFSNEARNGEICKAVDTENAGVYETRIPMEHTMASFTSSRSNIILTLKVGPGVLDRS